MKGPRIKTIDDVHLDGKIILMRCDFNVPLSRNASGNIVIADASRIEASLPTIEELLRRKCKPVICSHLGRPEGVRVPDLSLRPVADVLSRLVGVKTHFVSDCIGADVAGQVQEMAGGEICLLENVRFYAEEKENDPAFSRDLAISAEAYVNNAFATSHRRNASMYGVTAYLSPNVAGYLVEREIRMLDKLLHNPSRPFVMIIGGAKLSTKLDVIRNMLNRVDYMIVGGALAFTFLKAQGYLVGSSPFKDKFLDVAKMLINEYDDKLLLPRDWVIAPQTDNDSNRAYSGDENIPNGFCGVDIGRQTTKRFSDVISGAGTVFWNGPMGVFETSGFESGTKSVAQAIANCDGITVIGGGDTAYALRKLGFNMADFGYISTGGGATLKYLQTGTLDALRVLDIA